MDEPPSASCKHQTANVLPPVDADLVTPAKEPRSGAEVSVTNMDQDPARPPADPVNPRPPSLLAHESAIEYESFSYATLPNSAPPDVLARWRHLRIHGAAHALSVGQFGGDEGGWDGEPCCRNLLRRRVILFLVLLLAGVVMAVITVATVWITTSDKHEAVHNTNGTNAIFSS